MDAEPMPGAGNLTQSLQSSAETDLGWRTLRGGVVTLVAQGIRFALQFVSLVVLARLLTPDDFGLYSLGIAVTAFVILLKDHGLGMATVQRAEINQQQISALFWVNTAMGVGLALATVVLTPPLASLYGEPRLFDVLAMLSLGYIATGITVQPQAVMRRRMHFGRLALIDLAAMTMALGVAIAAAWKGAGYWSLIAMQLVFLVITALGTWLASQWRPSRPARADGVRALVHFGGHITGTNLLGYLNRNVDNLLIGWRWGLQQVGFYDKAYQMLLLPLLQINVPLSNVALPVLSHLQNDAQRYRAHFARWVILCPSLGMPLIAFLFVTADRIIPLVLGEQWAPSILLFRALAPAAFLDVFTQLIAWVYISLGRTARQLRAILLVSLLTLGGFLIGLQWGALGVALAYSACRILVALPLLIYACADSPLHWVQVVRTVARPAVAAVVAAVATLGLEPMGVRSQPLWISLSLDALVYGSVYLGCWVIPRGGTEMLLQVWRWLVSLAAPTQVHRQGIIAENE